MFFLQHDEGIRKQTQLFHLAANRYLENTSWFMFISEGNNNIVINDKNNISENEEVQLEKSNTCFIC